MLAVESIKELPRSQKEEAIAVYAEKAARSFKDYCLFMDHSYEVPRHLAFLINKLEAVERGDIRRLMISMPPRHGKTETVSKKFPAWFLGRHPDENVILSSYSFGLVKDFSRNVRNSIESQLYKAVFDITTSLDARAVCDWDIANHRGGLLAQSVGGAITGYGAHLFIIDDPFKNMQEADSANMREMVWEWYQSVVLTRLEPNSRIVLIMTRWNRDDLAGRIMAAEKDWDIINLPALAEEGDVLGRLPCEALWPERFPAAALAEKKCKVGTRVWAALFNGNPKDPESQKFSRDWFKMYNSLPREIVRKGSGVDTATSLKSSGDNTALCDVYRDAEGFLYVNDLICDKMTVSAFAKLLINAHKAKSYDKIKLEKNNAGEAFKQRIDEVAREESVKTGLPVAVPVECEQTSTDKMVRAMEFQPLVENGTLRFRAGHAKIAELIEHLVNFDGTGSDVDDDIDALGFAIKAALDSGDGAIFISTQDVY